MEKPKLIYLKNVDKRMHRIIIPKSFVDKFGKSFYMEVYDDKIILKPVKKGE